MKFLADENLPLFTVKQLKDAGIDIEYIAALNPGINDIKVLELANMDQRILITFDSDFGNLIFKKGISLKAGVIFLRLGRFKPEEPGNLLLRLLKEESLDFDGKLSVVTRQTVRQRKIKH